MKNNESGERLDAAEAAGVLILIHVALIKLYFGTWDRCADLIKVEALAGATPVRGKVDDEDGGRGLFGTPNDGLKLLLVNEWLHCFLPLGTDVCLRLVLRLSGPN